jgi:hypothetical protein
LIKDVFLVFLIQVPGWPTAGSNSRHSSLFETQPSLVVPPLLIFGQAIFLYEILPSLVR